MAAGVFPSELTVCGGPRLSGCRGTDAEESELVE